MKAYDKGIREDEKSDLYAFLCCCSVMSQYLAITELRYGGHLRHN